MHRRHRITGASHVPDVELGSQLGEPGRQHGRILRIELPGHPDLGQVPVRVLQGHAGLSRPAQAAQHRYLRPILPGPGEPGI